MMIKDKFKHKMLSNLRLYMVFVGDGTWPKKWLE